MTELQIKSSLDQTIQPSLFWKADGKEARPLLVGLHTWSFDRYNQKDNLLPFSKEYNWNLLLPEFRGPNSEVNPNYKLTCASNYAKTDIIDAVEFVKGRYDIDTKNIFLLGASGGGHMALMIAGLRPMLWKAVTAFVPISDLSKWYFEVEHIMPDYTSNLNKIFGGPPNKSNLSEYKLSSPIYYIDNISKSNLKIFHGKFDKVVNVSQSLELFNKIQKNNPKSRVFLNIFDGGHEMPMAMAIEWLLSQYREDRQESRVTG